MSIIGQYLSTGKEGQGRNGYYFDSLYQPTPDSLVSGLKQRSIWYMIEDLLGPVDYQVIGDRVKVEKNIPGMINPSWLIDFQDGLTLAMFQHRPGVVGEGLRNVYEWESRLKYNGKLLSLSGEQIEYLGVLPISHTQIEVVAQCFAKALRNPQRGVVIDVIDSPNRSAS